MSIIDQISQIEDQLLLLRKDGDKKILEIQNNLSIKKKQMREHFALELQAKQQQLEQEMQERVQEYKIQTQDEQVDIVESLTKSFDFNQKRLFESVTNYFWKE